MDAKKRIKKPVPTDPNQSAIRVQLLVDDEFVVRWADLPEWVNWIAVDANGDVWAYESEPEIAGDAFVDWHAIATGEYGRGQTIGRLGYGVANWRETLTKRPGGQGDE